MKKNLVKTMIVLMGVMAAVTIANLHPASAASTSQSLTAEKRYYQQMSYVYSKEYRYWVDKADEAYARHKRVRQGTFKTYLETACQKGAVSLATTMAGKIAGAGVVLYVRQLLLPYQLWTHFQLAKLDIQLLRSNLETNTALTNAWKAYLISEIYRIKAKS